MTPKIGQIWREVDPRMERHILIVDASDEDWFIQTCTADGERVPRSRVSKAREERFNGKRGGYAYIKDKKK